MFDYLLLNSVAKNLSENCVFLDALFKLISATWIKAVLFKSLMMGLFL